MIGAGLSVSGDAGHNELWIDLFQHVIAQPKSVHDTGCKILDEYVYIGDKFFDQFLCSVYAEV